LHYIYNHSHFRNIINSFYFKRHPFWWDIIHICYYKIHNFRDCYCQLYSFCVSSISPIRFSLHNTLCINDIRTVDVRSTHRLWHARPALFRTKLFSGALTPSAWSPANKEDDRKFRAERDADVFTESSRKNWSPYAIMRTRVR